MKSILVPVALFALAVIAAPACSGDQSGGGAGTCVTNQTVSCACVGGVEGVQTCLADGTFSTCDCGAIGGTSSSSGGSNTCNHGTVKTCGDGAVAGGEQCDDGNCIDNDDCTNACTTPICGDSIVQAGEDCDDGNGEQQGCPANCKFEGSSSSGGGSSCAGKLIFAGFTAQAQESQWSYMGELGLTAGTKMCEAIGATDVCDYTQLKEVLTNQAAHKEDVAKMVAKVPANTNITVWVNRTTAEMVNGIESMPGPGGRCNEWVYKTNHISDGEYLTVSNEAGNLIGTFSLDSDTMYTGQAGDGHASAGLDCGQMQRYIPCCFPVCKE